MENSDSPPRIEPLSLETLPFLQGKRLEFDSVAEILVARADEIPETPCVLYYDQTITYRDLNERSNKVANYLRDQGVGQGDVVSIMVLNSPEIYYTMFGAQKLGAIAGMINFALKGPEIAYLLADSKPKIVFVGSEFMADFAAGLAESNHKPLVVEVETDVDGGKNLGQKRFSDILSDYPAHEALVSQSGSDPFLLLYSSGTTGRPKGVLLSNEGQLSICRDLTGSGLIEGEDVMIILLPMFHINPIGVWTFPLLYAGQTLCIRKAYSPADFWPAIVENGVTILMGVPAMYNYVYHSIDPSVIDRDLLKLKYAFCGAAPLSVELIRGFREKFGVEIIEGYGLTEATGVSTINPVLGQRKPGSIGMALSEQDVRIMDDNLNEVSRGDIGEICIKGAPVMLEYFNRPEATEETLNGGWLKTGDVAYMDKDGFMVIVDRKKDMINRGGENIYPREIEIELEAHPAVLAVAVIGIPDEALGERVKAVIEVAHPEKISQGEIQEFLKERLAGYKIPEFIQFVEKLPRNPTGKILKPALREMAQKG